MKSVTMEPVSMSPPTWIALNENGGAIDTTGTHSCGLQEALNYCAANKKNLKVYGGGFGCELLATASIVVPPLWQFSADIDPVRLVLNPPAGQDSIVFDSCVFVDWNFRGQISTSSTTAAIRYKPRNGYGAGGPSLYPSFGTNRFYWMGINGGKDDGTTYELGYASAVIHDLSFSESYMNTFEYEEIKDHWTGIQVLTPAQGFAFQQNFIKVTGLNFQKGLGVWVANAPTTSIYGNTWDIKAMTSGGAGSVGFLTHAQDETIFYSNRGTADVGIKFEDSAARNRYLSTFNTAAVPVLDMSAAQNNTAL